MVSTSLDHHALASHAGLGVMAVTHMLNGWRMIITAHQAEAIATLFHQEVTDLFAEYEEKAL
jgi:hypothetical protein